MMDEERGRSIYNDDVFPLNQARPRSSVRGWEKVIDRNPGSTKRGGKRIGEALVQRIIAADHDALPVAIVADGPPDGFVSLLNETTSRDVDGVEESHELVLRPIKCSE